MNSSIQVFSNNEFTIRTINDNSQIWFVAKDIMNALEYSDTSTPAQIMQAVPEIWKGIKRIDTPGGKQDVLCISEQGLYFFLGRSDKPKALPYQIWVAGDVIPSIRKTGNYITNPAIDNGNIAIRKAELLRSFIDICPMTDETKIVFTHEAFKLLTGHECLSMLPKVTEPMYSASDIGKMFGVSKSRIGKISKQNNLKSEQGTSNEYGTWIRSKSPYSNFEYPTFVYNDKAVAWFKEYFTK